MGQRSSCLRELIDQLVGLLASKKGWNWTFTVSDLADRTGYCKDMVYRWKRGVSRPSREAVETLIQIGKKEAGLDRDWGEQLLKCTGYRDASAIVEKFWGPKEIRTVLQNLPAPEYTNLIGRQDEIRRLLSYLSPEQHAAHLISVDGIGGVGKTALVLEVAYRCLRASTGEGRHPNVPTFGAIIFVSAKQQYLTSNGPLHRSDAQRTLRDIFRTVAQTLNRSDIADTAPQDQRDYVRAALAQQQTLLIVDNLETMEDKQEVVAFLYDLPPRVKAIMTTRERVQFFSPIRLEQLQVHEALDLIAKEAEEKEICVSQKQAQTLYDRIGGIPAALVYSIGQHASGYSLETVLERVPKANGDVARFCFEGSVAPLREQPAHRLLMTMALFPKQPLREALAYSAGLATDRVAVEDGLAQLQLLSLINQQEERYRMLPLTHEYALAELAEHPDFEREARARWVEWYLDFTRENGGDDWTGWQTKYDRVEEEWENLLAVFDWCAAHDEYDAIRSFWQEGRVLGVADIYGFWADRLFWLDWLIEKAEGRADWSTAVEAMGDRGFILTLMNQLEEAERLLCRAWHFHEMAALNVQIEVAQEFSLLRIYQGQYEDAFDLLSQAQSLLDQSRLGEPERTRLAILTLFYTGFLHYKNERYDYTEAGACFDAMVAKAQTIKWQRAIFYAQNFLANIAIADGKLQEAELLLRTGLVFSQSNKDKRRTAHYQCSFARLEKIRGNIDEARRRTQAAHDGFEHLGMRRETKIMREHLQRYYAPVTP